MNILLISEEGRSKEALLNMFSDSGFYITQTMDEEFDMDRFALIVIGAGRATTFGSRLGSRLLRKMEEFVFNGGRYLGICAGSYMALQPYNRETCGFSLSHRQVVDLQNWDRGCGEVRITWKEDKYSVRYENGPILADVQSTLERVVATYDDGFDGVMVNGIAAIEGQFGLGRYFLFGFHPELNEKTRFMVDEAIEFLFPKE